MDDNLKLDIMTTMRTDLTAQLERALLDASAGIRISLEERAFEVSAKEARRAVERLVQNIRAGCLSSAVSLREGVDGDAHYHTLAKMVPSGCVVVKLLVLQQGKVHGVKTLDDMRALSARTTILMPKPSYYLYLGTAEALVAELSEGEYSDAELVEVF